MIRFIEPLETRRLCARPVVTFATDEQGVLVVTGTNRKDDISVNEHFPGSGILDVFHDETFSQVFAPSGMRIDGRGGGDRIVVNLSGGAGVSTPIGPITILGGNGGDTIVGSPRDDVLEGGNGRDDIDGAFGNDTLRGGNGKDHLSGGAGDDNLSGDNGSDSLDAGDGNDSMNGGDGNDTLSGDAGDDTLLGDAGRDTLEGGDGSDHLAGGAQRDRLTGGAGADVFSLLDRDDELLDFIPPDDTRGG